MRGIVWSMKLLVPAKINEAYRKKSMRCQTSATPSTAKEKTSVARFNPFLPYVILDTRLRVFENRDVT